MAKDIVKIKYILPKNYQRVWGAREVAEKILGELKVADSFLYMYLRFGKPTRDTHDEYKISYEYVLRYGKLVFDVFATTPDMVYVDCFMPESWAKKVQGKYNAFCREVFEKAYKEDILFFPYVMPPTTEWLSKEQNDRWNTLLDKEAREYYSEDAYRRVDDFDWTEATEGEKTELMEKYLYPLWEHLQKKFKEWAVKEGAVNDTFYGPARHRDLRFLPEIEEEIKAFCNELLTTVPVRDCDINIRGWQ